jgi:hypothetical protein
MIIAKKLINSTANLRFLVIKHIKILFYITCLLLSLIF